MARKQIYELATHKQRCKDAFESLSTHHVSYFTFYATLVSLLFLTAAVTPAVSSELRTSLLNKALSENLIRQPQLNINDMEPRTSGSNHNAMQIGIRWLLLMPIRLHQKFITNQDGDNVCTFEPSCSHYGLEAIRRHGLQGLLMASNRLLRCYSGNHKYYSGFDAIAYDPVPSKETGQASKSK